MPEPAIPKTDLTRLTKAELAKRVRALERQVQKLEKQTGPILQPGEANEWAALHRVAEHMPLYLAWMNRKLVYQGCNHAHARAAGLKSPADIVGMTDLDLPWTKEETELYRKSDRKVIRTGEPLVNREATQHCADGTVMDIITSKVPMRDAKGRIVGVISIFADITERKQAEESLHLSESRLKTILDNAPIGISLKDREGRYLVVNTEFCRTAGKSESEILGKTVHNLIPEKQADAFTAQDRAMLETGEPQVIENVASVPTGDLNLRMVKFPITDSAGEIAGIGTIATDVTERKKTVDALRQSEDRFKSIFNNAQAGIGRTRLSDGKALMANETLAEIFGYKNAEDFVANFVGIEHYADPKDRESLVAHFDREGGRGTKEIKFLRRDGSPVTVSAYGLLDREAGYIDFVLTDISEQKRAEEALRESEERYRDIVENVADLIQSVGPDGKYVFVNEAWRRTLGYTDKDLETLCFADVVHKDFLPHCQELFEGLGRGENFENVEVAFKAKDGRDVIVEGDLSSVMEDGRLVHIRAVFRDITERKQVEEALKASEFQLRLVTDNLPSLVAHVDREQRYKFINKTGETWFDRKAADIVGNKIRTVLGPKNHRRLSDRLRRALNGEFQIFDATVPFPDGETRNVEVTYLPHIGEDGDVDSFFIVAHDITARKHTEEELQKSEERLRQIYETSPVALFISDLTTGEILFGNPAASELTGLPHSEIVGAQVKNFYTSPTERNELVRLLREQGSFRDQQLQIKRADGEPRWVSISGRSIVFGGRTGFLSALVDITERREAEKALAESEERFRSLVETIPHGIQEVDPAGTITFANSAHSYLFGTTEENIVGRPVWDFDAKPSKLEAYMKHLIKHEPPPEPYITKKITNDGREIDTQIDWSYKRDGDGKLSGFVAIITDITERLRSAEALRDSEERSRAVLETVAEGIIAIDNGGIVRAFNPGAAAIFGYTADEIIGENVKTLMPDSEAHKYNSYISNFLKSGDAKIIGTDREVVGQRKDGSAFPMELAVTEMMLGGEKSFTGIVRDITERKQAEAALKESEVAAVRARALLEDAIDNLGEGFALFDPDDRLVMCNDHYRSFWGDQQDKVVPGVSFRDLAALSWDGGTVWDRSEGRKKWIDSRVRHHREAKGSIERRMAEDKWALISERKTSDGSTVLIAADISERKKAEEDLRKARDELELRVAERTSELAASQAQTEEAHARLTAGIEAMAEGFALFGADDQLVLCNSKYREFLSEIADVIAPGVSFEEIIRASVKRGQDSLDGMSANAWTRQRMKLHARPGEPFEQHLKDDRWLLVSEHRTPDGQTIATYVDITELKAKEQELRQSEQQLADAIESISEGFVLFDAAENFVLCNSKYRNFYPQITDVLVPGAAVEDIARIGGERGVVQEAIGNVDDWLRERLVQYRARSGTHEQHLADDRWVLSTERGTADGGIVGIRTDITELKRQELEVQAREQQLRLITDNVPVLIAYLDTDCRYRFINEIGERLYARSRTEIEGLHVREIFGKDVYKDLLPRLKRTLAGESLSFEMNIPYPDGVTRDTHVSYVPHFGENKNVVGFFVLTRDITEQKRTENQLRQAQKSEAVGQLTGGVAHDFNNILGIVLGNLDLLDEKIDKDDPSKRFATAAIEATLRGAEQTQRLLAFARQQPLAPQSTNVRDLIGSVTGMLDRILEASVEIESETTSDLWAAVVDAGQLENALVNLALNSRDAMPEGGTLRLEARNVSITGNGADKTQDISPGDYVAVSVADTGTGMAPEVVARTFDPFFTTKDVGKGSGLGLSMVFGFIKQSAGHVRIESVPGKGTKVCLYLPRAEDKKGRTRRKSSALSASTTPGSGETILVVEDNPDLRVTAVTLLKSLGYDVLQAEDSVSALTQLDANGPIDLMFTDVVIPGAMNGRKLAEEAQRRYPDLKILFTSGYTEDAIIRSGAAGGIELIGKPYQKQELGQRIRLVLDGGNE